MLSKNFKVLRYAGIFLSVAALCSVLVYPFLRGESAAPGASDLQKQMDLLKNQIERQNSSPALMKQYYRLANVLSSCSPVSKSIEPTIKAPFSPQTNLCINGALAVADPNYNRILASSTGTGVGTGVVGNCSLSGSGTATEYDVYSFNLTGCAAFPTVVTASLCGPAGCTAPAALDTVLTLYRNVPAGDPLTANGGLPAVFNPASACTNARAANDDSGTTPTSTGGSTCNQLNTADCLAQCSAPASTANSEFKRSLGSGRFTLVVTGFGNATVGSYNLYVDAPSAGCVVTLAPSAASATIGGQVRTSGGIGISKAIITLSGNGIETMQARTNGFGYYTFGEVPVGENYVLTVNGTKLHTFANPTKVVTLESNISDADFVSEQ